MLTPFALPANVASIWRPLTEAETDVVFQRLVDASDQIRDETPLVDGMTVDERLAAGRLRPETVKAVAVAMVHRIVSVPGYLRQSSVTIDGDTKAVTYDSSVSSGEMTITDREMARLTGRRAGRSRAFTIFPSAGAPWT